MQPPSGGCVLKHHRDDFDLDIRGAAAFGRLCVETLSGRMDKPCITAAAFGRLCVETALFG